MAHISFLVDSVAPVPGGMQAWAGHLIHLLAELGHTLSVYILGDTGPMDTVSQRYPSAKVVSIANERQRWMAPLSGRAVPAREQMRLNFLLSSAQIESDPLNLPRSPRLIMSAFATGSGVVAQHVSNRLGIPHIACVVGTDLSRGTLDIAERSSFGFVVEGARWVVALCDGHRDLIMKEFESRRVTRIYPSIDPAMLATSWAAPKCEGRVEIFSDCGYAFKKGTHILVEECARLREERIPLRLTVCGATLGDDSERRYWESIKRSHPAFRMLDLVSRVEVNELLLESHVYATATLGEGCSLGRVAALCSGIPVVTTRCGEMPELAANELNVTLSHPGDSTGFGTALRAMCERVMAQSVKPQRMDRLYGLFHPLAEKRAWEDLIRTCLEDPC